MTHLFRRMFIKQYKVDVLFLIISICSMSIFFDSIELWCKLILRDIRRNVSTIFFQFCVVCCRARRWVADEALSTT
jgi:hypothetical protein